MKVLMVGNSFSVQGGITSVIRQILNYDWDKDEIEIKFIPTYINANVFFKTLYFFRAYMRIRRELTFDPPDLVHIHMSFKGSFFRKNRIHKICRKKNIPDVIHLHGSEFEKWYLETDKKTQEKIKRMLREASGCITLGKERDSAVKRIEPETKTFILCNAVELPKEVSKWNNDDTFQILYMGVLIKRKGIVDLLRAVRLLKETGRIQGMHFIIAGSGSDERRLEDKVREYKIEEYVEFAGWVEEDKKRKIYMESQLMVLPSYNEGLPMSILEGMSYGLPIVATKVGDVEMVVKNDINGFLFTPGDFNAMAEYIYNLRIDKEGSLQKGKASRRIIENGFSAVAYYERLKSYYLHSDNRV